MPFGVALSTHPVSSHATGEVIGQVLEEVGAYPDAAVLLATPGHAGALEDVAAAVQHLLAPTVLVGATSSALIGQGADDAGGVALALWAAVSGPVSALRLGEGSTLGPAGRAVSGAVLLGHGGLGEPGSPGQLLAGQLPCSGVAGARVDGGPLLFGGRLLRGGAVGVAFGGGVRFEAVTARAWRAVGPAVVVTDADPERGLVRGLDGVPALDRLRRLAADEVPAEELTRMNRRLGLGPEDAGGGASAVVEVRGADRSNGALAAGPLEVGQAVHFWVRGNPGPELRRALAGRRADTALAFVADPVSRGYGPGDHDAEIVAETLGTGRVAGLVAAGQVGSVGGQLRVLDGEASIALLADA